MISTTCPSLTELGIEPGSFIRKLDRKSHWNGNVDQEDISRASQEVAAKIFNERGEKYSLWKVKTSQDFYGVIASLTANANPKDRDIDFIWISEAELDEADIPFEQVPEGGCFQVRDLHFDASINSNAAQRLCSILLTRNRLAQRCKKASTIAVREYQKALGCQATDTELELCKCQDLH